MDKKEIKPVYCAIYTRKSTNEGLERDFTTLDSQRESAESYIKSQKSQGWVALPEKYDDGGCTGANIERPALQELISDIKAGKINCVVVYKVDRLSRSLLDFTRLLEFFEEHNVTFVSVTQHFNTETSMGRLTLNILLSFAQFEREMISERTRDKMGAARKKGKWIGGQPPLGYDIDKENHKLVINEQEAKLVRKIFDLYLEQESILDVVTLLNSQGYRTKKFVSKTGRSFGGIPFTKSFMQRLLNNPIYTGKVCYKGQLFDGEHEAIISEDIFYKTKELLAQNRHERRIPKNVKCFGILSHILRCQACNCRMIHTYTTKNKKRHQYYVCLRAQKEGYSVCPTRSVNAQEIEEAVIDHLPKIDLNGNISLQDKYRKVLAKILSIWDELIFQEKHRMLKQLIKEIDYNAENGSLGITVNEKGIHRLYNEIFSEKDG